MEPDNLIGCRGTRPLPLLTIRCIMRRVTANNSGWHILLRVLDHETHGMVSLLFVIPPSGDLPSKLRERTLCE